MKAENFYESFNGRIVAANLSVLLNSSLSLHICCNICSVYACVRAYVYLCVCVYFLQNEINIPEQLHACISCFSAGKYYFPAMSL